MLLETATNLNTLLNQAMPLAGSRQLEGGPTTEELEHEASFSQELFSILLSLYRLPFFNGLLDVDGDLVTWIRQYYLDSSALLDDLHLTLEPNLVRAFEIGGQIGLDELDISAAFTLENAAILGDINTQANELSNLDGELSLAQTTANETARFVERQREDGLTATEIIAAFGAYALGRTIIRSSVIAHTESVGMSRFAMVETFVRNGVSSFTLQTVEGACPICLALDGEEYQVSSFAEIPSNERIPLHTGCRCFYLVGRHDGTIEVWTGA